MISFRPSVKFDKEAIVILISKEQIAKGKFGFSDKKLQLEIVALSKSGKFAAEQGEVFPVIFKSKLVLLIGVGKGEELTLTALRMTVRKAVLSSFLSKLENIEILLHEDKEKIVQAALEGLLIGTYAWKKYISKDENSKAIDKKNFWIVATQKNVYDDAVKICAGVNFARDLINDNADTITSVYLETAIREIIKGNKNISLEVLNKKEMTAKGLNLHLAVNQGSHKEPKLIIVKYNGVKNQSDYTALIGKGITFDTGGLNLKPTGHMETMRTDMSGAAAVIGTLKNILSLNLKKNIIFAIAVAENVIGSGAFKPGDVFRGYSGKTVEIGNTDAEGRLVLADAISYVTKNYKPAKLIDIATLTGACVVALGHDYSGLMSNDDLLAEKLLQCAEETDDRAWRLPVYPEIKDYVKSPVADIKNTSLLKGAAGASTAAEFLRQFVGSTKWAHLDIAGTAFCDGQGRFYFGHGATGAGVRLLTEFVQRN